MAALPNILRALKLCPQQGLAGLTWGLTWPLEVALVTQYHHGQGCLEVGVRSTSKCTRTVLPYFQVHRSGALPPSLTPHPLVLPRLPRPTLVVLGMFP